MEVKENGYPPPPQIFSVSIQKRQLCLMKLGQDETLLLSLFGDITVETQSILGIIGGAYLQPTATLGANRSILHTVDIW